MHAAYNTVIVVGLAVAGALLSIVHSFTGSVGTALVVAGATALVCGLAVARPSLIRQMGLAMAVVAAFTSGFAWVGVGLLAYGGAVHAWERTAPQPVAVN